MDPTGESWEDVADIVVGTAKVVVGTVGAVTGGTIVGGSGVATVGTGGVATPVSVPAAIGGASLVVASGVVATDGANQIARGVKGLVSENSGNRNPPVPGTGKGAGKPQYGSVKPGQPGPPKVNRPTHGPKKSDAPQEAGRQGRHGGVIGSRGDREKMGGRQDQGHQGGPPHGHPPEGQGKGHLWERPR